MLWTVCEWVPRRAGDTASQPCVSAEVGCDADEAGLGLVRGDEGD